MSKSKTQQISDETYPDAEGAVPEATGPPAGTDEAGIAAAELDDSGIAAAELDDSGTAAAELVGAGPTVTVE